MRFLVQDSILHSSVNTPSPSGAQEELLRIWLNMSLKQIRILGAILWLMSSGIKADDSSDNFAQEEPDLIKSTVLVNISTAILQTKKIPVEILQAAQGIIVIPILTTGGLLVTASTGKGLVVVRQERQWSAPVLITFSGAGAGLKAGFKTGSIVLVFTRHQELDSLLAGNLKLGTDLQVATGTNKVNSYVYDYSDELGLFAGIGIEGTAMQIDHILNEGLYGKKVSVATIFAGQVIPLADIAKDAMNNLKLWLTVKTK